MPTIQDVQTWRGRDLYGPNQDKIGSIDDIYLDRQSGEPEWLAIKTGLFGSNVSFVPIEQATSSGDNVSVPFDKALVKDAPNVSADGELSPEEERRLWEHYGRSDYDEWQGDDRTTALDLSDQPQGAEEPVVAVVRLRRIVVAPIDEDRPPDRA